MPRKTLTRSVIRELVPSDKPYEIHDDKLPGLLVRVNTSGRVVYVAQYARGKRITIGRADVLTPSDARDRARAIMAEAAKGHDPMESRRREQRHTLASFIDNEYGPWVKTHHRTPDSTLAILGYFKPALGKTYLDEISAFQVERWRSARLKDGAKPSSVNRYTNTLVACLSRAVDWGHLDTHPLKGRVKPLKTDSAAIVRYLDDDEEARLLAALDARDEKMRVERDSANEWRRVRGYNPLPPLPHFGDHLTPMVAVSLNTGLRRGELFALRWRDVDLDSGMVAARGDASKSGTTRHVPLNEDALDALVKWREQSGGKLVFPGPDGERMTNVSSSWRSVLKDAKIADFRWHDQRHHFASKLVMAGVDLNTVRELLGHADVKMTLRYAHLAPHVKREAVSRLVRKTADVVPISEHA